MPSLRSALPVRSPCSRAVVGPALGVHLRRGDRRWEVGEPLDVAALLVDRDQRRLEAADERRLAELVDALLDHLRIDALGREDDDAAELAAAGALEQVGGRRVLHPHDEPLADEPRRIGGDPLRAGGRRPPCAGSESSSDPAACADDDAEDRRAAGDERERRPAAGGPARASAGEAATAGLSGAPWDRQSRGVRPMLPTISATTVTR